MFVAADHRGRGVGVAQTLIDMMMAAARRRGVARLWLGTADRFRAAHRFYERNGFQRVEPENLPSAFPRMAVDSRFYMLPLD